MPERDVLVFDGACGVCTWLADWVGRRDARQRLTIVPYQTADLDALAPGLTREMAARSVYLVTRRGRRYHGARAAFETLKRLPGAWRVAGAIGALPPLSALAQPFYRLVANHRAALSRRLGLTACAVPPEDHGEG